MKDTVIIIGVDAAFEAARQAQELQNIKDAAERHQRRMAKYRDWVNADNIAERALRHAEEAAKALERGMQAGRQLELLPVPDPLPKHMVGQSASAIQAMLRSGWKPEE